jgi:hypothetical protein
MTKQIKTIPMTAIQATDIETKIDAAKTSIDPFKAVLSEGESASMRHYSEAYSDVMTELGEFIGNNPGVLASDVDEQNFLDAKVRKFRMIPIKAKINQINKVVDDMDIVDGHIMVNFMDIAYSSISKLVKNGFNDYKPMKDRMAAFYKKINVNPPTVMELTPALEVVINNHKPGSRLINSGSTVIEMHLGADKTKNPVIINPDGSAIIPKTSKTILIVNRSKTDDGEITFRLNN